MRVTVSDIKGDVGSLAGHVKPHPRQLKAADEQLGDAVKTKKIKDYFVSRVGDDIHLIMNHENARICSRTPSAETLGAWALELRRWSSRRGRPSRS